MKKIKAAAATVCAAVAIAWSTVLLWGCYDDRLYTAERLNAFADELALALLGDDAYAWNVYSITPEESYGYERGADPQWYSYSKPAAAAVRQNKLVFEQCKRDLDRFNPAKFSGADAVTYNALKTTIDSYLAYYGSKYAVDFELFGGSYINSQGGYVADFADMCENYTLRTTRDADDLLAIAESVKDAFATYLTYVDDRADAGYPLYDRTITEMCDFLDNVSEQGDEYYLYGLLDGKIDGANFLTAEQKAAYKTKYKAAIKGGFMVGVAELSEGLNNRKGAVTTLDKAYLASYGAAGKAYYKWLFSNRTGIGNANIETIYNNAIASYYYYLEKQSEITSAMDAIRETDGAVYNDFNAYKENEKVLLGITEPSAALEYLTDMAGSIVPVPEIVPEIDFKYMDKTSAEISHTIAYYVKSPLDEQNAKEHITINGVYMEDNKSELLTTLAHEGYPGHLYSHVNSKALGVGLLPSIMSNIAFSEGWAKYVELALLRHIEKASEDKAVKAYCDYSYYSTLSGYIGQLLYDIQVNYLGMGVNDYIDSGIPESSATEIVGSLMENPGIAVPYGYGMYYVLTLHDEAKSALGEKYDEVKYNAALLSEGYAPTLPRAKEITKTYIEQNK